MSAQGNLSGLQFSHISLNNVPEGDHMILAHNGDEHNFSGLLTWDNNTIQSVSVKEKKNRRKGLATEMFRQAKEISPGISHSGDRTDAGESWARSVGGAVPPRDKARNDD